MFSTRPPAAGLRLAQRHDTECGRRGGFELAIVNIGEDPPLGRLGGFDAGLRLNNAGAGSFDGGAGGGDLGFRRFQRRAGALCGRAIVIRCWAETAPRWERVLERTWRFAVESSSA